MSERLLRQRAVCSVIGISRAQLYRLIKSDDFPRPVRIGARAVAWRQSEVEEWMASREAA